MKINKYVILYTVLARKVTIRLLGIELGNYELKEQLGSELQFRSGDQEVWWRL